MKVVLATLNAKYIHTSLALRCLKAYSGRDFDIDIAEYTIKDPAMNIVADLFARRPDVVGFSCYIWNIEETITVIGMLRPLSQLVRGRRARLPDERADRPWQLRRGTVQRIRRTDRHYDLRRGGHESRPELRGGRIGY